MFCDFRHPVRYRYRNILKTFLVKIRVGSSQVVPSSYRRTGSGYASLLSWQIYLILLQYIPGNLQLFSISFKNYFILFARLPLVISAGFTLLHIFVNYVPRIEINVEVQTQ